MKKTLVATALALALAGTAYAGTAKSLVVSVPFDFTVGETAFVPGDYRVALGNGPGSVEIESTTGDKRAFVLAQKMPGDEQASPVLTFHVYGDSRFLAKIQAGGSFAWQLARSSREKALGRDGNPVVTTLRARSE